jgi:pimeloyl-ACP methyl ester carboxylesterase
MHVDAAQTAEIDIDASRPPKPSPVSGWMTASDGARIPYRVKGSGPALIMIPGWSQSGAMFQHQLDCLSDHHRVIVPDIRGHGEAPSPDGGLRMARLGQDVAELLDHLNLDRANMLGWSMGASVLWAYVDLHGTSAVDRFIFVDQPSTLTMLPGMTAQEAETVGAIFSVAQLYELYTALHSPDCEATRSGFVAGMVTKTIARALYDWILAENRKTPCALAADLLLSHCANDWRDVLPRIDRPTLVVGGTVSHVPPASQRYIQQQIPGSVYHEFGADEGGAHFSFLEAPAAFNRVIRGFLSTG